MIIPDDIEQRITDRAGASIARTAVLGGGCVGDVRHIELADGRQWVAKLGPTQAGLAIEGFMLNYLAEKSSLPVPDVFLSDDDLLVMAYLPAEGPMCQETEIHAADLVAALHEITNDTFGFKCDTVLGGLHQPNPPTASWLDFFRDARLIYMATQAHQVGRLSTPLRRRLDNLAARLDNWLDDSGTPALLHGDLWGGNILTANGRVNAFIDPAIHYGDPEIELAFTTLFQTFSSHFFDRYREHRDIAPGFFETRCDLYNLYPLLVHVRLFGGSYVGDVDRTLKKFGC